MRGLILCVLACVACGKSKPVPETQPDFMSTAGKTAPAPEKTIEASLRKEVRIGDIGISVSADTRLGFWSVSPGGNRLLHQPECIIAIDIKNYNANTFAVITGQTGKATLKDDVGNTYRELGAKTDVGFDSRIDGQIRDGYELRLRANEPGKDVVVFEKPVPGAKKFTLALSGVPYGEKAVIRFDFSREDTLVAP